MDNVLTVHTTRLASDVMSLLQKFGGASVKSPSVQSGTKIDGATFYGVGPYKRGATLKDVSVAFSGEPSRRQKMVAAALNFETTTIRNKRGSIITPAGMGQ